MKTKIIESFSNGDTLFPYFSPATRYIDDNGAKVPLIAFLINQIDPDSDKDLLLKQKSIIKGLINSRDSHGRFEININNHTKTRLGTNNYKALDIALINGYGDIAREILKREDISLIKPVILIKGHSEYYKTPFAFAVDHYPAIAKEIIDKKMIDTIKPVYYSSFEKYNAREYVCSKLGNELSSNVLENDLPF